MCMIGLEMPIKSIQGTSVDDQALHQETQSVGHLHQTNVLQV